MKLTRNLALYLIIGVVLGLVVAFVGEHSNEKMPFVNLFAWFYAVMIMLALPTASSLRVLFIGSILPGLLSAMIYYWPNTLNSREQFDHICLFLICVYGMNAFNIALQKDGFDIKYKTLFHAVWDTILKLMVACIFMGLANLVLFLWGALFSMINIDIFKDLFDNHWFALFINSVFAAFGLWIATSSSTILGGLRFVLLGLFKYLFPVISIISVAFMVCYIVFFVINLGAAPISFGLMFLTAFVGIISYNAVFQYGEQAAPYPVWLMRSVNLFVAVLPVFALIALAGLFYSGTSSTSFITPDLISIYGLHNGNFNTFVVTILLILYSCSYAMVAINDMGHFSVSIEKINIALALILIAVTLLLNNPIFSNASINPAQTKRSSIDAARRPMVIKNRYDGALKGMEVLGLHWSSEKTTENAIVLGYAFSKPYHACQMDSGDSVLPGVFYDNDCWIIHDDTKTKAENYRLLVGDNDRIAWRGSVNLYAGYRKDSLFRICRAIHNNHIIVGIKSSISSICRFVNPKTKVLETQSGYQPVAYIK